MKVLYIGNWKDGTGWSNAAINNILALDSVDIDVVPRHIKLNHIDSEIPDRLKELEKKDDKNCDVCIQHVLPHLLDYNGRFDKNIVVFESETSHFRNSVWAERINTMDQVWVPNIQMMQACEKSYVFIPIARVPHAADMFRYQQQYEPLNIEYLQGRFVFYFIGELNRRKNIVALIKAFHLEFDTHEPVALLIKGNVPGQNSFEVDTHLKVKCDEIKRNLKLYPNTSDYHAEVFLNQRLTEHQIIQLHATGDCLVAPSFGEAWCIPAFDSMAMGKTPICTDIGGPSDYLDHKDPGGWLVRGNEEPCFGMTDTFVELYHGDETWINIDVNKLRNVMREVYTNKKEKERRSINGINNAYDYSYNSIGILMKNLLEGTQQPFHLDNSKGIKIKHDVQFC